MIAFGPVPSRRLGISMGINNIPPKYCSYSCVYCQVGRTTHLTSVRNTYYNPEDIFGDVQDLLIKVKRNRETIDYFTFVPDGEPTLDMNLGNAIDLVKLLDSRVAVITNGSLISQEDVQNDLFKTDYVCLKIDTVNEQIWKKLNRPCKALNLSEILNGMCRFSEQYEGILTTETMLIDGMNTGAAVIGEIASFVAGLNPHTAYIAIPTRPVADRQVASPSESVINHAYHAFAEKFERVEYLIDYEGDDIGYSGEIERDLLNIASVHPLRYEAVERLLAKADANWQIIEDLIMQDKLKEVEYAGHKFYLRCLPNHVDTGGKP